MFYQQVMQELEQLETVTMENAVAIRNKAIQQQENEDE